jgi:hypothetical protein
VSDDDRPTRGEWIIGLAVLLFGVAFLLGGSYGWFANPSRGSLAEWFAGGATLLVAIVALYQDVIKAWLVGPTLVAVVHNRAPDCVSVPMDITVRTESGVVSVMDTVDSMFVRFRVENRNRTTAEDVQVYAGKLSRLDEGTWVHVETFPPMNLCWSDMPTREIYYRAIGPFMSKHCDLLHITDPAGRESVEDVEPPVGVDPKLPLLEFELLSKPNHGGHIVRPGTYRVDISIAAKNARSFQHVIEVEVGRRWSKRPEELVQIRTFPLR